MKSTSNVIPKSAFAEGLDLCEKNGEKLLKEAIQAFQRRTFVCAFILGFTAWEEFGKASLILEYWNEDFIKYDTWKKEFLSHRFKIHQARYISDKTLFRGLSKELGLAQHACIIVTCAIFDLSHSSKEKRRGSFRVLILWRHSSVSARWHPAWTTRRHRWHFRLSGGDDVIYFQYHGGGFGS